MRERFTKGIELHQSRLKDLHIQRAKLVKLNQSTSAIDEMISNHLQSIENYQAQLHLLNHAHNCKGQHKLAENKRQLTVSEERVNWTALQATFDKEEEKLRNRLEEIFNEEINRIATQVEKRLSAGEILFIGAIAFALYTKLKNSLQDAIRNSYEQGRKSAAGEVKIDPPKTTTKAKQLMRLDSEITAETVEQDLNNIARNYTQSAVAGGAAAAAIGIALRNKLKAQADKYTTNLTGTVPGVYINQGRTAVFDSIAAQKKIVGYQRSEILDDRVCNMCLSLDGRIVKADDPMRKLDLIHANCRGIWVFLDNADDLINPGLPKSIMDNFETVGGVPIINNFTQLKKPIK